VSTDPDALRALIVNALRLAALSAEDQAAALPEFVHVPDEVALIYDDAYVVVPQLCEAGVITDNQAEALSELDRQFTEMSDAHDRATLWTREAMRVDKRWSEARRLATQALSLLGAAPGPPDFSGITFVQG
jgi:hypothetical protein